MKPATFLWLDIETTGLNPHEHDILEFCAIVTGEDLVLREQIGGVLKFDLHAHDYLRPKESIDDFVRNMHTENGLWDACHTAVISSIGMEHALVELIRDYEWTDGKPILAGSSVHFDRSFLAVHCPRAEAMLHHRHHDASTLKKAARIAGIEFKDASKHRAAADVRESLEIAQRVHALLTAGVRVAIASGT